MNVNGMEDMTIYFGLNELAEMKMFLVADKSLGTISSDYTENNLNIVGDDTVLRCVEFVSKDCLIILGDTGFLNLILFLRILSVFNSRRNTIFGYFVK